MDNQKIIVFDFDGVIVDTYDFCYQISKTNNPDLSESVYRSYFEGNINDSPKTAQEKVSNFDFFALYTPQLLTRTPVVGISELIRDLSSKYPLAIISSTNTVPIEEFLKQNNLRTEFSQILGNDVSKSKVDKFIMLFNKTKLDPKDFIFVTDTLGDIKEARRVKVESVGVSWSNYSEDATILSGNPYAFVKTPAELRFAIERYFKI